MTAGPPSLQQEKTDWLHSAPYFLIALGLHLIVLFFPLTMGVDPHEVMPSSPVTITLQEKVPAPQAAPPSHPDIAAKPVHREKVAPINRPVIAMAAEPVSPPATFAVPAPVIAPAITARATAPMSAPAAAPITTARFDAAYLHNPHPDYPPISRRLGEEGKVLLRVRVTPDGRAASVEVEKGSGFDRLDDAALRSVTRWRFVPAKRGDEAIEATVIVPIVFRLDNSNG